MDLVTQLLQEHKDYVAKLTTLAEAVEGIRANGRDASYIETVNSLFAPFTTELDQHAAREEDFLFPRILERAPDSIVPTMIEDHEKLRKISAIFGQWYPIWREGEDSAYQNWADSALELRGVFSAHMQKENIIVFPLARRILTPEEIAQLVHIREQ